MIRVLKILVTILLSSLAVHSQIYIKPNNSYGVIQNRQRPDSTSLIPTFSVAPSGTASLHSINQKMGALYYDTSLHRFSVFDPSDSLWTYFDAVQLNDSMFKVGRSTITIRGTGGGGVSNYAALSDVTVATPKNGNIPVYDSITNKWKNVRPIYFSVMDYGAKGDSTTDDRSAIMKARDAAYAAGGVLFFPAGKYRISDSILFNRPIRIQGVTKSGGLHNNQSGGLVAKNRLGPIQTSSEIVVTNGKNGFVFDQQSDETKASLSFESITMSGTVAPGSATGGAFIVIRGMLQGAVIRECTFYGGYVQVDVQSGYYQVITGCHFSAPQIAGIKTGNTVRTDTGDFTVLGCTFNSGTFNTISGSDSTKAIWWYSGGGMRVIDCKFDAAEFNNAHAFVYEVYCANTLDPTSDIMISNNSFENWSISAIYMRGITSPYVRNIHITANQFAPVGSTGSAIDIDKMESIVINDFAMRDWGGTVSAAAIKVTNSIDVTIGKGEIRDYSSKVDLTGSTNTHVDYMHGYDVAIGSKGTVNITGQPADKYTTLTILGRATSGTFGSGLLELANKLPDGTGVEAGVINFVHGGNTSNKNIATIAAVTEGSTASNRGGHIGFYTKTDGTSTRNEAFRVSGVGAALPANYYLNWATTYGGSGYGIRDNSGAMEFKDASGAWTAFNSLGGGGSSANGPANRIQISAGSGVFTSTPNFLYNPSDSSFTYKTVNSGIRWQQYTGGSSYYAGYATGVTPADDNYIFAIKNDGSETYMNASSSFNFTVPGLFDGHFTSTGFRQSSGSYHNFGATAGSSGYGFRDNGSGAMQIKNSTDNWYNIIGSTTTNTIRFNLNSAALNRPITARNTDAGNFSGAGWILFNDVGETIGTHGAGFEFYSSGTSSPYTNAGIFFNRQGPLAFLTGSSESARILTNGNVLIGSTTDNAAFLQLPANTTSNASLFLTGASSDVSSPTNGMLWYNSTTHALNFRDNGTTTNLLAGSGLTGSGTSGRVAIWNGSSSLTSDANYLYGTSNNGTLSIGTTNTQGHLNIAGNKDLTATGMQSYFASATYTDQTTAASGTSSSFGINYIASPTIAAANTSVTFPSISTLMVDPPTGGTNAIITDKWAIETSANGNVRLGGFLRLDDNLIAGAGRMARVTNVTASGTLGTNVQVVKIDASGGGITTTLPSAGSVTVWNGTLNSGIIYKFIRTDNSGNTVTISAASGETINGSSSFTITGQYTIKEITATSATAWLITQ